MRDLETQALTVLTEARRRRFEFLTTMRDALARTSAESFCWGVANTPGLDRNLVLIEDALTGMVDDQLLAARLATAWAVDDAQLLHSPGQAEWCAVCRDDARSVFASFNLSPQVAD